MAHTFTQDLGRGRKVSCIYNPDLSGTVRVVEENSSNPRKTSTTEVEIEGSVLRPFIEDRARALLQQMLEELG